MAGKVRAIGDLVSEVIATFGHGEFQAKQEREAAWDRVVDQRIRPFTMLGALRRGVLEIMVQDAVTLQELTFSKELLLKQMQDHLPDQRIQEFRFRVGH